MAYLGVGLANDLCEPGAVKLIGECRRARLCDYLTVYVYDNYSPEFLGAVAARLPRDLRYVWHASDDFELPCDRPLLPVNRQRIETVTRLFSPAWITEDVILTTFGRSRPQGEPNYVQPFLTEACLEVCIRRMREIRDQVSTPFFPEVPHFYMPGPDEMHVSTFFRRFVEATGALLNFDVGHFFSYNLLHGKDPLHRIEEFPLDSVGEINAAGGMIGDADGLTWIDHYAGPLHPLTVETLRAIMPRCTQLQGSYAETIGAEPWVLFHNLEVLNDLFWSSRPGEAAAHVAR